MFNEELGDHPERINENLKRQLNRLNFKNVDFPASFQDYQIFEKNNEHTALTHCFVFFQSHNSNKVKQEYISKHNFTRTHQVPLLKINNGEKWHFTALKPSREEGETYKLLLFQD